MSRLPLSRPVAAGILGCLTLLVIGWTGLLVPSLIRSVKEAFDQSDAGLGLYYLVHASAYAFGSVAGGLATERLGRRTVLVGGAALHALGLAALGASPAWSLFVLAALPTGLGAGTLDGGANGLILDLYTTRRGRALNLLHLFFSIGALVAPVTIGQLVAAEVGWQVIVLATAAGVVPLAVLYALVAMPGGRRERDARRPAAPRPRPSRVLVLLGLAIGLYVAAEVGVSSWLVRFLEPAPITTATLALSLYWAGLAVGRLVSSQLADRFDHRRFAAASALGMAVALAGAIAVPSLPLSMALFGLAGVASGPIYPMIVAIGGDRYPDRAAAVSGFLGGAAIVGSVVYPPVMGFLSVTVGLPVAMAGNVLIGLACVGALLVVEGTPRRSVAVGDEAGAAISEAQPR